MKFRNQVQSSYKRAQEKNKQLFDIINGKETSKDIDENVNNKNSTKEQSKLVQPKQEKKYYSFFSFASDQDQSVDYYQPGLIMSQILEERKQIDFQVEKEDKLNSKLIQSQILMNKSQVQTQVKPTFRRTAQSAQQFKTSKKFLDFNDLDLEDVLFFDDE